MPGHTKPDTKSEFVKLRLSGPEKQAFSEAAKLAGLPVSAWVRERLRAVATKELENAGHQIPFLSHIYGGGTNGIDD